MIQDPKNKQPLGYFVVDDRTAEAIIPKVTDKTKSRSFVFRYAAKIDKIGKAKKIQVWLPVPTSSPDQQVELVAEKLSPWLKDAPMKEPKYGNTVRYLEFEPSESAEFQLDYKITRKEVRALERNENVPAKPLSSYQRNLFLSSNGFVPVEGKPTKLLPVFQPGSSTIDRARLIYDRVDQHVTYDKTRPGYGNGDVNWVCDSRFGNCTDFHSLFISMARSQRIPSRFEIGFPIPNAKNETKDFKSIGGYHCWASFFDSNKGWVPVDISEADKDPAMKEFFFGGLTSDRVAFTVGRDIVFDPPQAGPSLNYFVYPYVEVDGKPLPKKKLNMTFGYRDN